MVAADDAYLVIIAGTVLWALGASFLKEERSRRLASLAPTCLLCGLFPRLWHAPLTAAAGHLVISRAPRGWGRAAGFAVAFGAQLAIRLLEGGMEGLENGLYLILTLRQASAGAFRATGRAAPSSLEDHLCYCLGLYGLFTGPLLTYEEHREGVLQGRHGRDLRVALRAALGAALSACAYLGLQRAFPFWPALEARWVAAEPRVWVRLAYLFVSLAQFRYRFYFAWLLMEAAGALLGVHPSARANADVCCVEFTTRVRARVRAWNASVARFLAREVYEPLPGAPRLLRAYAVFLLSAFWHDNRPWTLPLYAYFLHLPLATAASEAANRHVYGPLGVAACRWGGRVPLALVRLLAWLVEVSAFNYFSAAFVCPHMGAVRAAWRAHAWLGHAYLAGALGLTLLSRGLGVAPVRMPPWPYAAPWAREDAGVADLAEDPAPSARPKGPKAD